VRDATDPVTEPGAAAGPTAVAARIAQCAEAPWDYDYFALLRRLEALAGEATPRWGRALRPTAEPLRIGQEPTLSFAPAAFSRFDLGAQPPRLRQQFFSYLGPNGPLPIHLSDFIRERALNRGDPTWLAFLDTFLHRFALHLYRAWAQARPAVSLDRPAADRFRAQIGALAGIGGPARQQRDTVHDDARLHFTGHLARRVHNAESVEAVLGAYFAVPVRLEPWVGHWMRLPAAELTHLRHGVAAVDRSTSRRLGRGALLGTRVWDRQHRVRLHIGPLPLARYLDFLPSGRARAPLRDWMRQLTGEELAWDAQLVLRKEEVPPTRLGARQGNAPRLGWVSWLGTRPRTRDAADVRIDEQAFANENRPLSPFSPSTIGVRS
jgi:type VI secretion system protein ImpH